MLTEPVSRRPQDHFEIQSSAHVASKPLPKHTWRLTFAYDGDNVSLARAQRVAMIAPPVVTPPPAPTSSGFWLEVRDKGGKLIFHRPLHNPLRRHVEQFGEKKGDPMQRISPDTQKGEFQVLVPDLPAGAQFTVHGAPVTPTASDPQPHLRLSTAAGLVAPNTVLVRQSFDDIRKLSKK